MSDSIQQWILKQPVTIEKRVEWHDDDCSVESIEILSESDSSIFLLDSQLKEFFQPLDVESLQTQLEELLQEYGARFYADYEVDRESHREQIEVQEAQGRLEGSARKEFANAVLVLFGSENKETE